MTGSIPEFNVFKFFTNVILIHCWSTQVSELCHIFSSDNGAGTYTECIFNQFPEQREILSPLGKGTQLKVSTFYVLQCELITQLHVVSHKEQIRACGKCFLLSKQRSFAIFFAKYESQKNTA
jgi:hypothetical protein